MGITFSTSISDLLTNCLGFLAKPTQYICELEGNLDALQIALEKVSTLKNDVMGKVNIVERQQTKQLEEIQQWLIQVEAMETLVNELINDGAREIEKRCLNGCCPRDCSGCSLKNCTSIYKLGKDVAKKIDDVDTLYEQGHRFRVMANRLTSIPVEERPNEPTVVLEEGRLSEVVAGGQLSIPVDDMPSESTVVLEQGSVLEVVVNGLTSPPADERLSEPTVALEQGGIFEVVANGLTSIATIERPSELTVGLEEVVAVAGRLTSTIADERPSESTAVFEQGSLFEVVVNGLTSPPVDERPTAVLEQGRIFEVVGNGLTSIATIDRPRPSELTVDLEEVSAGRLTSTAADERPSEPIAVLEEGRLSEAVAGRPSSTPVDEMPSEPIMGLEQGRLFEVVSSGLTSPEADERPSEATVGLESSFAEVWSHIIDEQVGIIGLYGMSGIGKTIVLTKIRNKLCDPNHGFNGVIWVEMSKNGDPIVKDAVQDDIGKKIGFDGDIWKNKSREEKAIEIFNVLSKNKFVLFLDDIRERLKLSKLGIPPPNNQNNSKIIFTTKYEDMCNRMKAHKKVEVKCLSLDEAWVLYDKMVPKEILSAHPETHKLAKIVAAESIGLPLALKHVGQAMACEYSPQEWRHAGQVLISVKMLDVICDMMLWMACEFEEANDKFLVQVKSDLK
ncbi:hypothetical protein L1049_001813 [Liquidambar formosana]|uniref:NB-ARC domain-containing protein n=1 Tax=Liquidambar formosana TaxID=63359 RepID=A0AAP0N5S7_LIQFO